MVNFAFAKHLKTAVFLAALSVAFAALPALADTSKDQSDELKNESSAAIILSENKPKNYSKAKERLVSIVTERAEILKGRWEALALRLENISERLSSRMSKMEKTGYDISEAQELIKKADSKIEEVRDAAKEALSAMISEAENSDGTAKDLYRIEKGVINPKKEEVGNKLNEAKDALNDVLKSLIKAGRLSASD